MSAAPSVNMTELEYLVYERQTEYKSEFLNGEMFAMAEAYDKVDFECVEESQANL